MRSSLLVDNGHTFLDVLVHRENNRMLLSSQNLLAPVIAVCVCDRKSRTIFNLSEHGHTHTAWPMLPQATFCKVSFCYYSWSNMVSRINPQLTSVSPQKCFVPSQQNWDTPSVLAQWRLGQAVGRYIKCNSDRNKIPFVICEHILTPSAKT